jgi:hypothetical protein
MPRTRNQGGTFAAEPRTSGKVTAIRLTDDERARVGNRHRPLDRDPGVDRYPSGAQGGR